MPNSLEMYFFNGKKVRVVNRDGVVWFVANDVGKVLGLTNIRDTIRKVLDASEWTYVTKFYGENVSAETPVENSYTSVKLPVENFYTSGKRSTKLVAINESGLYTLIMRSTRPEAKAFRQWVTNDVIPSIINTGSYSVPKAAPQLPEALETTPAQQDIQPVRTASIKIKNKIKIQVPADKEGYYFLEKLVKIYA